MYIHRFKKGQAEVIGGIIAISVLILSITTIYFLTTSTYTSTSTEFAKRTAFEAEKNMEKISIYYDQSSDQCIVSNVGAIDITIVRQWYLDNPNLVVEPANPIKLSVSNSISWSYSSVPDYIVTSRGNVFTVKVECEKIKNTLTTIQISIPSPGISTPLFTSENLLNHLRLSKGMQRGYLYATIQQSNQKYNKAVLYYNGTRILCSSINNKNNYGNINFTWDLDNNAVKEIIISGETQCPNSISTISEYTNYNWNNFVVEFVFKNLISILRDVDTVTIYFKIVAQISVSGQGNPHAITFAPFIELSRQEGNAVFNLQAPATVATSNRGLPVGNEYLVVFNGYTVFPVKGFNLNLNEGVYNMTIRIYITQQQGRNVNLQNIRLEYLAIVGADIADPWK
ncbi:MAG: hypothetical protein LM582_07525 [Desulfurococcaceae archaeon]|nr:hypothetical protein [Desulfurococcaceae archaeon]